MFRVAAALPVEDVADPWSDLLPLSLLSLEMDAPSDWRPYLEARGVAVVPDDVGRDSVSRSDARTLLAESRARLAAEREAAARRYELREHEAEIQDRERRAQIWQGVAASSFPAGVSAASVMVAALRDSRPRRESVLQEALSGDSLTFHPIQPVSDES